MIRDFRGGRGKRGRRGGEGEREEERAGCLGEGEGGDKAGGVRLFAVLFRDVIYHLRLYPWPV